ncbi:MAG TPA: hypothetical protein PK772_07065, partial [Chitinophagaceae bacterium]|nr:hypothetical protein [Chitinophagaceae bacterium]
MKQQKHTHIRNQHMRTLTIIIFTHLLINSSAFAQVSDKGFPSPNAAALGKYADYPVSYFTGVPAINIPLYTLKDGAATLPISLSYHASGIKVGEVASSVGLGWVLNAGGVITRTIKGAPDEGTSNRSSSLNGPRGYYQDSGLSDKVRPGSSTLNSDLKAISSTNSVDMEPDIYTLNVDGFVGKFVFDEKRNPTFLTKTDIEIAVDYLETSGGAYPGEFLRWVVTTLNGVQYIFGENGAKDINKLDGSTNRDDDAPTSWYLTKIIYPNSTDSITIEYTPEKYTYRNLGSEFIAIQREHAWGPYYSGYMDGKIGNPNWNTYSLSGVLLKKIATKNIELNFIAATVRRDVEGAGHCLDKIQIKNKNTNTIIDEIKLNYDYFQSSSAGSAETGALGTKDTTDTRRLKLINVQRGITGSPLQASPYSFQYYEDIKLPRRCSYDQDHWGYANGWGGQNFHFTPYPKPEYATLIVRPDPDDRSREPAWPYTQAFSLKKIIDPLGVNTSFEFESNLILKDTINGDKVGGGLRIKRITVNDTVSRQKYARKFDYSLTSTQSTGVILRKPAYWTKVMNEYMVVTNFPTTTYAGDAASGDKAFLNNYFKFSQSPFPLQDYQGYAVGYKQVKEIIGENGENGYKIYNYQAEDRPSATTRLRCSNYTSAGIPNGKFNSIAPENLAYSDPSTRGKYFPFEPEQVILSNGLLTKEQTFNKNNTLLSTVDYSYETKYNEDKWIRGMICMPVVYTSPIVATGHTPVPVLYYPFTYYKYHTGITRLLSQKTTAIDTLTGKNAITEVKYAYESSNHLQPTRQTTTNSTGDTLEAVMRYAFDFDNTAISGGVIEEMKKQNILTPLRTETWRNNTLLGFTSTEYAKNTIGSKTVVLPTKTYTTESKKAISSADIGFNKSFANNIKSLTGTSSYVKQQGLYSYNDAGLLQQQSANNTSTAYIW